MTKQAELSEELGCIKLDKYDLWNYKYGHTHLTPRGRDKVLAHLKSKGVVIKVDRELPEDCIGWLEGEYGGVKSMWIKKDKLKQAGYVAVEELI